MKLEYQVVELGLSQKIKELGVKQESLWYHVGEIILIWNDLQQIVDLNKGNWTYLDEGLGTGKMCSAFTVAELGEMLPPKWEERKWTENRYGIHHRLMHPDDYREANTEANARASMLIYLIKEGLLNAKNIK